MAFMLKSTFRLIIFVLLLKKKETLPHIPQCLENISFLLFRLRPYQMLLRSHHVRFRNFSKRLTFNSSCQKVCFFCVKGPLPPFPHTSFSFYVLKVIAKISFFEVLSPPLFVPLSFCSIIISHLFSFFNTLRNFLWNKKTKSIDLV